MKVNFLTLKSGIVLLMLCSTITGLSQEIRTVESDATVDSTDTIPIKAQNEESIWTRKKLTGDWGGARSSLKKTGITIKSTLTNFYQGMVSGEGNKDFEFGSKLGFATILNGEKLGLWKGFFAVGHFEYNMGQSVNGNGGTLLPVNTSLAYPGIEGADRFDVSFYLAQFLSKTDKVVFGKMSTRDLTNFSTFSGGGGRDGFQNTAFITAPNGITTPDIFGLAYMSNNEKRDFTFMVYDATSSLNKVGFKDRFQNGVTFFGSADIAVKIAGLKGKQGILGVASTKNVYNSDDIFDIINPNQTSEKKSSRWTLGYYFEQALYQSATNKNQHFGLYGQAIITDGEGSPVDFGVVLGLGGKAPFKKRPLDHWGIGYFNYSFSDGIANITIPTIFSLAGGESGMEAYYNAFLTPWFSIGADFQWIQPGIALQSNGVSNSNTAFLGLRSGIIF
ncbi:carbohydrate porin [Flavobacterium sp. LHD-80]|uniref:carbohydrate porin n=1 Tax=Flavobacterium sp. LHD-80 TaxID=3071411 RepID=UPI0027DFABF4|nr:carbohydrate porin [Flavobacterium sp. LHD-80]MDQ6473092.1 carbohydrate porin [Flavobacterium sp. LHD-80]